MARLETLEHQTRAEEITRVVAARVAKEKERREGLAGRRDVDHDKEMRLYTLDTLERELGMEIAPWRTQLSEGRVSAAAIARGARIAALLEKDVNYLRQVEHVVADLDAAVAGLKSAVPKAKALAEGVPHREAS